LSAAALLLIVSPRVYACTCINPGPPCQAYWNSQAVFSGTALGVTRVKVEWEGQKMEQRLFRFRVEEVFHGVEGKEVEVLTGAWSGDCGYDFQIGTKYLVYGGGVKDKPWIGTSVCTRTRPLSEAAEDLSFIRGAANAPAGGEIFGSALRYRVNLETGEWDEAVAIAGARVTATSGERRLEELTGGDGTYRFRSLPPGKYTLSVTLPPNLSPQKEQTVEVHDRGCAQIDYRAVVDGRIAGRLVGARGQSPGIVAVDLLPVEDGKQLRALWAVTEQDGSFEFKDLPPGRYVLGVNIGDAPDKDLPYKTTYYPSTPELKAANVLKLGEGQHLSGIEFRLPPPLKRRAITGVVVWPDGRPVARGEVSLTEVASGRPAGMDAKVDAGGRFSIEAFEGVRYKLSASVPADPKWNPDSGQGVELLVSPEVEVTPSARPRPLRLVIDTAGDGVKRTRFVLGAPRESPQPKRRKKQ
jgi:hypothetical protein